MGYSVGYSHKHKRDVGYGVPAKCDHPDCNAEINRGLSYVCGGQIFGGEHGCGLFFCGEHLVYEKINNEAVQLCDCCLPDGELTNEFSPKPDVQEWIDWKLTDESWEQWRNENKEEVKALRPKLNHV
jgi:hypothetical protein